MASSVRAPRPRMKSPVGGGAMEKYEEKLLDKGHVMIFGNILEEKMERVIEQLLYLETKRGVKTITVWIDSTGGLLQPALAVADVFEHCSKPIKTIGIGSVESAATFILVAGTKGMRYVSRNCSLMVHEFSWSNSGSYTEMTSRMKEIEATYRRQFDFLSRHTGKSEKELRRIVKHEETWLTPEEAIEWGFVDDVY